MKKIWSKIFSCLFITFLLVSTTSFAAESYITSRASIHNLYVGLQLGTGWIGNHDLNAMVPIGVTGFTEPTVMHVINRSGPAGRLSVGYDANAYIGLETGSEFYAGNRFPFTGTLPLLGITNIIVNGTIYSSVYDFDLLLKGTIPLPHHVSLFFKGGWAYVIQRGVAIRSTTASVLPQAFTSMLDRTFYAFRPKVAGGIAYAFNQHIEINLAYSLIIGIGQSPLDVATTGADFIPHVDMVAAGLVYHF